MNRRMTFAVTLPEQVRSVVRHLAISPDGSIIVAYHGRRVVRQIVVDGNQECLAIPLVVRQLVIGVEDAPPEVIDVAEIKGSLGESTDGVAAAAVCDACDDTHAMWSAKLERTVPCTRCPTPCEACGAGAYCAATPCDCDCHITTEPIRARSCCGTPIGTPHSPGCKACLLCGAADRDRCGHFVGAGAL
jgi:hypothetical protein